MAFTRAQATGLLNKTEMRLYDDSRANALRGLDRAALEARMVRTRTARDRARDLLKRQRLAARKRGEGKADGIAERTARKESLLVEILQRFTEARRAAPATKKAATRKTATKKAATKKAAAAKAGTKEAATRKAAPGTAAAGKATAKKTATRKSASKKATRKATARTTATRKAATKKTATKKTAATKQAATKKAGTTGAAAKKTATGKGTGARRTSGRRAVSPEKALENTRRLLDAKHERDRTPQPWQSLDATGSHVPQSGFQSSGAAAKAQELHAGEARMAQIHGSMSTRDRHNQGKRDHRNDDSD